MKIAFLTPEYPHPKANHSAGLGYSIKSLAKALVENGVEVCVFIYGQEEDAVFTEDGIKYHIIKKRTYKLLSWYAQRKFIQSYINKYIALDKIDLVEVPDWTGVTAFMKLNCPTIIRFHGNDTYFCHLEGRQQKWKNRFLEGVALRNADFLTSVSQFTARKTKELFKLKRDVKVIYNSINKKEFQPQSDTDDFSIFYFGTLIRKKGVLEIPFYLNKVTKQFPNCRFIFAGADVIDAQTNVSTKLLMLGAMDEQVQKNSEWLGAIPYSQVKGKLANATVVILPSYAEALPMTWLEAMAMEKALVTSDIGWAKEIMIDGKTGFTENPKKHQEFTEKIIQLLQNPELRQEFGIAARKQVEQKFDTAVVLPQNIDFYKKCLNQN